VGSIDGDIYQLNRKESNLILFEPIEQDNIFFRKISFYAIRMLDGYIGIKKNLKIR
jgi:hypothetical protein